MPLLRGHHLICLHFFDGEGYDDAFIKNLKDTLHRADEEEVTISSDADEVCETCLHLKEGRCEQSESADKEILEMDAKALELLGLSISDSVRWNVLSDKIPGIFPEWYSLYCKGCGWKKACNENSYFQKLLKE